MEKLTPLEQIHPMRRVSHSSVNTYIIIIIFGSLIFIACAVALFFLIKPGTGCCRPCKKRESNRFWWLPCFKKREGSGEASVSFTSGTEIAEINLQQRPTAPLYAARYGQNCQLPLELPSTVPVGIATMLRNNELEKLEMLIQKVMMNGDPTNPLLPRNHLDNVYEKVDYGQNRPGKGDAVRTYGKPRSDPPEERPRM